MLCNVIPELNDLLVSLSFHSWSPFYRSRLTRRKCREHKEEALVPRCKQRTTTPRPYRAAHPAVMADNTGSAYNPTTEAIPNKSSKYWGSELDRIHLLLKIAQLVLSFVAFICEEIIDQCESCGGLYFFEFVSCSAFLLAVLMLVVYWTPLKNKIIIPSFKRIDFCVTGFIGFLFLIASIVFAATMDKSLLGQVSVAFGFLASIVFLLELWFMYKNGYLQRQKQETATPGANGTNESQPLNTPVQATA